MKMTLGLLLLGIVLTAPVRANESGKEGPCRVIKQACEAAGFKKGAHKEGGKGLWKDCIEPLTEGKTVAGVSVTPEQVSACKAKREARKEQHKK